MKNIPLHAPDFDYSEEKVLLDCIRSGWVTSGKYIGLFENLLKNFTKAKYTLATSSGTSSLHISLICAGVSKDDEVLVPTITFVATINAVIYVNANPIFFDSDDYLNLDLVSLDSFLKKNTFFKNGYTHNKKTKKKIKAIIATHVFGNCCDITKLKIMCYNRNIKIIEDAAESLGSFIEKNKLKNHSGTMSLIGCFSFNGNKIITSGGGGAIVTNNLKIFEKAKYLINQAKDKSINFIHNDVGYNYRMSNLHAAVGYTQLKKIKYILKKKKDINKYYRLQIDKINGLSLIENPSYSNSNNWLNILKIDNKYKFSKKIILKKLIEKNIDVRPLWMLNHLQLPFKKFESYNIKKAKNLFNSTICLPSSYTLSKKQIDYIIGIIKK